MAVKLFILGLPGSGKSAVARYIATYVSDKHWFTKRFNDYPILYKMFEQNTQRKFKRAQPDGFDIVDISAFDDALQELEIEIVDYLFLTKEQLEKFVLIEFARNDYWRAFKQFHQPFLKDAYFIHLDAKIEVCKQRIYERLVDREYPDDDYPVSDYIFEKYYHSDDGWDLPSNFRNVFGIDETRLLILNNNFSLEEAKLNIERFIDDIIRVESVRFSVTQRRADHLEMPSLVNKADESGSSMENSESGAVKEEALVPR